jgi:fatty acid desaturase
MSHVGQARKCCCDAASNLWGRTRWDGVLFNSWFEWTVGALRFGPGLKFLFVRVGETRFFESPPTPFLALLPALLAATPPTRA